MRDRHCVSSMPRAFAGWLLLCIAPAAAAATWHVHADGGDASQCDGTSAATLAQAKGSRDCAWSHPFVALPPGGEPRIAGGDTLRIHPGSYRMGLGAPDTSRCAAAYAWDCHVPPVPSGSADRPTRILGGSSEERCEAPPELWGSERAARVLNLEGSRHVELACLEVTDRSSCIEHHCHGGRCSGEVEACQRDAPPFGDWAGTGIHAAGARDIVLRDLDVHGLAVRGLHVGRAADWLLERVKIVGNGWSGWDGDIGEDSGNSGTLRFVDVEIAWNGCGERWPSRERFGCWAQQAGGYGDGLGVARGGGHWIFERAHVHHNTSDGIDLLYLSPGSRVDIDGLVAEANAGNQLKLSGDARVRGARIAGDCAAFAKDAGHRNNLREGDHCRALGNAVSIVLRPDARVSIEDSAITGNGDCLVVVEGGDASAELRLRGNRLAGRHSAVAGRGRTCGVYAHQTAARILREDHREQDVR